MSHQTLPEASACLLLLHRGRRDSRAPAAQGRLRPESRGRDTAVQAPPAPSLPPQALPSFSRGLRLCAAPSHAFQGSGPSLSLGLGCCGGKEPSCSSKLPTCFQEKLRGGGGGGLPKRPSELLAAKERWPFGPLEAITMRISLTCLPIYASSVISHALYK